MINILLVIATLCQVTGTKGNGDKYSGTTGYGAAEKFQLDCQKYFLECVPKSGGDNYLASELRKCVLKRELK